MVQHNQAINRLLFLLVVLQKKLNSKNRAPVLVMINTKLYYACRTR